MFTMLLTPLLVGLVSMGPLLLVVALLTLAERHLLAAIIRRIGPSIGWFGLTQPVLDGVKLLSKAPILVTSRHLMLAY